MRLALLGFGAIASAALCLAGEDTKIPIDLRTMRPVLEVYVNGEGPFKFVLDTGASHTMVGWDLARRLDLPEVGTAMVSAPNSAGFIKSPQFRMRELRVGDLKFFGVKSVAIMDDNFMRQIRADGIVSAQDFRGYLVTLDYRQRELTIAPGRLPEPDGKRVLEYTLRSNIPGITLDVMGKSTFFHLDSGSPFYIALPGTLLTTIEYEKPPTMVGTAGTITGNFVVYYGKLAGDVKFGEYTVEKPTVEVLDKMPYGNLGFRFFRDYKVTFDYLAQRVRLEFWRKEAGSTGAEAGTLSTSRPGVAQWIEHQSSELGVGGSNPSARAT